MGRKTIKTILVLFLPLIFATFSITSAFAVSAESNNVSETVFFGNVKDDGSGCGVYSILNLIIDIFSAGVAILGVIGITIVGIKYLTAGGNEEQTRKARHRMLEIVIGLVTYALMYAGIQFLVPGGKLTDNQPCTTISDQELTILKEQEKKEAEEKARTSSSSSTGTNNTSNNTSTDQDCQKNLANAVKNSKICEANTAAERIAKTAEYLAWPLGTSKSTYSSKPTTAYKNAIAETMSFPKDQQKFKWTKGRSCSVFVTAVARASGYDKTFANVSGSGFSKFSVQSINKSAAKSDKWKKVTTSQAVRGDIFAYKDNHHVMIYGGKVGSKYLWYQADLGDYYGYASYGKSPTSKKNVNVWHATGK